MRRGRGQIHRCTRTTEVAGIMLPQKAVLSQMKSVGIAVSGDTVGQSHMTTRTKRCTMMEVMVAHALRRQTRSASHPTVTEIENGTLQAPSIAHHIAQIATTTKKQKKNHLADEASPATTYPRRPRAEAAATANTTEAADQAGTTTETETEIVTAKTATATANAPVASATMTTITKPQTPNLTNPTTTAPAATSVTIIAMNPNPNTNRNLATELPPAQQTENENENLTAESRLKPKSPAQQPQRPQNQERTLTSTRLSAKPVTANDYSRSSSGGKTGGRARAS